MAENELLEPERARELVASNEATVLDLREEEQFRDKRVPGARRVSEEDLDEALDGVADDQMLIVVSDEDEQGAALAERLREKGRDAACLEGGMKAWEDEKFPLQPSRDPDDDAKV
jgi:rhodanese-related sulfurtransferase